MTDFNLFDTPVLHPKDLSAGTIVYYADHHTFINEYLHGLQVCKVMVSTDRSFLLDNGRKFNPETGSEITKGNGGVLYPYTPTTRTLVQDAQSKLFLVNEVISINFSKLTTQQLSMILDVARGAFTQVSAPSPCGGGCNEVEPILSFVKDLRENTVQVAGIDIDISNIEPISTVEAPIGISDATYELSEAELDDIEDADEDYEYSDADSIANYTRTQAELDSDEYEDEDDDEEYAGNKDYE